MTLNLKPKTIVYSIQVLLFFFDAIKCSKSYTLETEVFQLDGSEKGRNGNKNETVYPISFKDTKNGNIKDWYDLTEFPDQGPKNKVLLQSQLLRLQINYLRNQTNQMELVFLIDASGSVGLTNFRNELDFVKKLLSDFTVEPSATRVAIVTFGGKKSVRREVDQISRITNTNHKCYLLNKQFNNITYTGGGTYTRGALIEALMILEKGRVEAKKVVFLITDGFSNGGDPRPAANLLKSAGVTVFTFGIRTGNVQELHDIASTPVYNYSYFLDSFAEFEALAHHAMHRDLKAGQYVPVKFPDKCNFLCSNESINSSNDSCCDEAAHCACGTDTGHYACICSIGYFGSGLKQSCQPCPNGTYASGEISGDSAVMCIACPDINHVTVKVPATSIAHCVCATGFTTERYKCEVITCPKLRVPENGYLVKANACSNVVHAACGIRCKIGFHLKGDSIRLCGINGTWSGNEPECLLKTCPILHAPMHGRVHCQYEDDYNHQMKSDPAELVHPIDTRCQFKCDMGFQLRGSKVRNCLPLARWDGLTATCKAIKCEPFKQIPHGHIIPVVCLGPEKVPFATNCTISCEKGFQLDGPRIRSCGGRGVWTQRHYVNRCLDKTPPSLVCPSNITVSSAPGENYAYVNWSIPNATDNTNEIVKLWTKPHITFPWKVKIGTRTVIYVAQDLSGNRAKCKFKVKVLDKEPPMIENCIDPPILFVHGKDKLVNVSWDEPGFYDNSRTAVIVEQSHHPDDSIFSVGSSIVTYTATDKYNNSAICVLNITVKDICDDIPVPRKGHANCYPADNGVDCILTCQEGFDFAFTPDIFHINNDELFLKCTDIMPTWTPENYVPDCSESDISQSIWQEGSVVLEGNETEVCSDETTLRELSNYITDDLRLILLDMCGNDIDCNLISFDPECEKILPELNRSSEVNQSNFANEENARNNVFYEDVNKYLHSESSNSILRLKRDLKLINKAKNTVRSKKRKERIEIKYKFVGRIIQENFDNPKEGVRKLREKFETLTNTGKLDLFNNKTNQEIAKLALNLHLVFKNFQEVCDDGSVLRKYSCVKCPHGTFYNISTKRCHPCPFGRYQDISGAIECKLCPEHTFTKKMHAKSFQDCIPMCQPGHYSRRRRYQGSHVGLEPCLACNFGSYQSEFGQTKCLLCPTNTTTKYRGATSITNCSNLYESSICQMGPCLNNAKCIEENGEFSCECRDGYIGSRCEIFRNPCDSSPCLHEGICNAANNANGTSSYTCTCNSRYTGHNCETYVDECISNPCQNNGKCISNENDYSCECENGFEGQFCEMAVNHCEPSPCEEGSTCRTINETWYCFCKPGFLGRHCNLLPCDWLPCSNGSICHNINEEHATRNSYRCVCPDGYSGENCTTKIGDCDSSPCSNGGTCINGITDYKCHCAIPFTGKNCQIGKELSSDYILYFTKSGITDYVMIAGHREELSEFSVCFWIQSSDIFNYGTVLSYATQYSDNALTLTDYNGFVLYINGKKIVTDIKVNDGNWHFLCVTWKSENGAWNIFVDGSLRDSGNGLAKGTTIQANGTFVIGQEQDRDGSGFSESESFLGKLTLLDIWDLVLTERDVKYYMNSCKEYFGTVIAWVQMQNYIHGDIMVTNSTFCRGCPLPVAPFKGSINISDDLSEITYYCETGHSIRFRNKEYSFLKLKCLKQGHWEGYSLPKCIRKSCGFPGHLPRGRLQGGSYLFGDEIHYSCIAGYELRGHSRRRCTSEGKWTGQPPICIGRTCKNLLAPENGDIEYIIEENERDDESVLQAGQQLEFKCNSGFKLMGEKYLTCLESGVWDHDTPSCVVFGCSQPKQIKNGYIISDRRSGKEEKKVSTEESYFFGDVVGFSCFRGFKFSGNNNLMAEFKLQCSNNGTWNGFVPDCVPLQCSWPNTIVNAKMFLMLERNSTQQFTSETVLENLNDTGITDTMNKDQENDEKIATFYPGTYIKIICDVGFNLIGNDTITCTEREEWSSTFPSCEAVKCSLKNHPIFHIIENEKYENINENSSSVLSKHQELEWDNIKNYSNSYEELKYFIEGNTYKDQISLTCKKSKNLNLKTLNLTLTNITWFCSEHATWKLAPKSLINNKEAEFLLTDIGNHLCEDIVACSQPMILEHGYIFGATTSSNQDLHPVNGSIKFKCHNGYQLEGNESSICLPSGLWSTIPSCKPVKCGPPPTLPNAVLNDHIKTNIFEFGNLITYDCNRGYILFGQASSKCLANGKWSRIYGKCSKLSCNKPKLPPGVTVYGRSYLYQDQLIYICPNGEQGGSITCQADGNWSDAPPCNLV